jgi:hypothetical protein
VTNLVRLKVSSAFAMLVLHRQDQLTAMSDDMRSKSIADEHRVPSIAKRCRLSDEKALRLLDPGTWQCR